ncbi:hypothetical protein GCM10011492_13370 [Flexivirga endophytica]|uniref:Uncharacterized protein n=1 Tax=Flexivirga endophytica TaxID=1849103 RepID=A0A916WS45_9MICO|nr:hypothetical protein GCM10011492_13370 [Flexivirga endophytica]GHB63432.1 hypothetical protein GCM10008112_35490 [Flexivirga endophytica]
MSSIGAGTAAVKGTTYFAAETPMRAPVRGESVHIPEGAVPPYTTRSMGVATVSRGGYRRIVINPSELQLRGRRPAIRFRELRR